VPSSTDDPICRRTVHASLASTARYTRVATKTISNTPSPLDRLRLEVVPPG
jgi:hypothetical protein